ncbi:hypothetical protein ACPV3A_32130 [Paenibacillus sp. Dod16]|uniref:hypothetical protein n=1 Tax=Paenibacillus TaxID=44249 RepID=UPI00117EA573|nr:hypothetical protein [Paenibacillus glucanolyticus]
MRGLIVHMMMYVESAVITWSITPGSATIERASTAAITVSAHGSAHRTSVLTAYSTFAKTHHNN